MIGLGSNRLTVCRRGGMSVTQAGRGGMEWLGVRDPIWASPYSAQATAALKDAFTAAQWQTIKAYGFAHPEIVGYMNAYSPEDAKIAYSLVEGIGTRWIANGGVAYIDTNVFISGDNWNFAAKFKAGNITSKAVLGCQIQDPTLLVLYNGSMYCYGSTGSTTNRAKSGIYTTGTSDLTFSGVSDTVTIVNNGTTTTYSVSTNFTTMNKPLLLFAYWNNGVIQSDRIINGNFAKFIIGQGNTMLRYLIPFKRNGAMGMIDLLTGTFYGNANSSGSFSESIASPS